MGVREGGSYIQDPVTGELRRNAPETVPEIPPAEAQPGPVSDPADGAPAADAPTPDATAAEDAKPRRARKET
ncbi:MAG: hypothetical protein B7Y12_02175 [Rhizobiales bacterium 24-66-13]|jgi:hypothetical protein|nr:MAG: hypothetical protein B7Z41_03095 [Rhizobiales bacterium 12-66-7]OYY88828.1 MAG: hypothetical protein B7Y61_01205 [Rhizobiales bacterium 35-66-30]OYZ82822.1 MAG: hypothetical protein B7Y12_02175 [Rhizobiales bacterium 24-66-13]OZB11855.1 MAG: hypothetical protein B7X67_02155 [Rhizobiales bacterium 39-66-18]HQS08720.1 hypothetical protein [Xanthobacteraceae bacterium]